MNDRNPVSEKRRGFVLKVHETEKFKRNNPMVIVEISSEWRNEE